MDQTRAALIVIDMQRGFLDASSPLFIDGAPETVPACSAAIRHCRENDIPVFFVTRRYRSDGSDVEHGRFEAWLRGGKPLSPGCPAEISEAMPPEFGEDSRDYHLYKPRYSAFFQTELDLVLRRLNIDTVILAGTTTPNCIRTTCYDAMSLDYNVAILSDCTSSVTEEIQKSNLRDMANIGAQILCSKDWISGRVPVRNHVREVRRMRKEL